MPKPNHPYFDSGVLIKLYVREANSASACNLVRQYPGLAFNRLHELEITNTFQILAGRGTITVVQKTAAEHHLASDVASGRLQRLELDWPAVFQAALGLSRQFSSTTLARSLDILHVAAAICAGARLFVTGDKRQAALAQCTGLDCQLL